MESENSGCEWQQVEEKENDNERRDHELVFRMWSDDGGS
jgi:hypothetical protein